MELFLRCDNVLETHWVTESVPVMEMKSLPWCEIYQEYETHSKTQYSCENITRQHCTSLWRMTLI